MHEVEPRRDRRALLSVMGKGRLKRDRRGRLAVVFVLVVGLGLATPAGADRKPNDREREGITRALDDAGFSCDAFPGARCRRAIKVSTENERWAAGYIKGSSEVQGGVASVKRKNHRWRIHQVGNGGGCDVSKPVARDLRLDCF